MAPQVWLFQKPIVSYGLVIAARKRQKQLHGEAEVWIMKIKSTIVTLEAAIKVSLIRFM